jgi:hypothetical protein
LSSLIDKPLHSSRKGTNGDFLFKITLEDYDILAELFVYEFPADSSNALRWVEMMVKLKNDFGIVEGLLGQTAMRNSSEEKFVYEPYRLDEYENFERNIFDHFSDHADGLSRRVAADSTKAIDEAATTKAAREKLRVQWEGTFFLPQSFAVWNRIFARELARFSNLYELRLNRTENPAQWPIDPHLHYQWRDVEKMTVDGPFSDDVGKSVTIR